MDIPIGMGVFVLTDYLFGRYLSVLESIYYLAVGRESIAAYKSTDELMEFCARIVNIFINEPTDKPGISCSLYPDLLTQSDSYIVKIKEHMALLGRYNVRIETYNSFSRLKKHSADLIKPDDLKDILADSISKWESDEESGAAALDHIRYRMLGSIEPLAVNDDSEYKARLMQVKEVLTGELPNPRKGWAAKECESLLEEVWAEKEVFRDLLMAFEAISGLLRALLDGSKPAPLPQELLSLGEDIYGCFDIYALTEETVREVAVSLDKAAALLGEGFHQEQAANRSSQDSFESLLQDCVAELNYYPSGIAVQWVKRIQL